ncbi:hypothetical protein [Archangium sp.]|uniref:hypothetical protein n=1 Tax=Archangium sp. TaxID=1872627 RepID=UPI00286B6AFD|nr:hypothetical protein [Archangium sp.]
MAGESAAAAPRDSDVIIALLGGLVFGAVAVGTLAYGNRHRLALRVMSTLPAAKDVPTRRNVAALDALSELDAARNQGAAALVSLRQGGDPTRNLTSAWALWGGAQSLERVAQGPPVDLMALRLKVSDVAAYLRSVTDEAAARNAQVRR